MSAQSNIFERMAADNDFEDFPDIIQSTDQPILEGNIFEQLAAKEEEKKANQFGFLSTLRDVGEQVVSKGVAGIAGGYGNILDTLGLQQKEGGISPAQERKYSSEFDVLEKMQKGERPSFSDLQSLSDEGDYPLISRLPTSKEVEKAIENVTGIGEGKTASGRIAGRGAAFAGEGVATGGGAKALLGLGASGLAGQGVREAGLPEALATGTEIAGTIVPSLIQGKVVPRKGAAKEIAESGRKVGLTEKQITPLIQGDRKAASLSKLARKGTKTKELFASIKEKLGDSYNSIKSSPEAKVKLTNSEQINLRKNFSDIKNELSRTLAPSPDRKAALDFIENSLETLRSTNVTPEFLVNFWQDINKSVKWNSIQGGKKALTRLKQPISQALEKASPQLAKDFEMTNELYAKYAQISKKLKPDIVDAFINKGEILAIGPSGLALIHGNPWALSALASEQALRILGREMLINPYFQNIGTKLVSNFNQSSVKGVGELVKQTQEYMQRKHPEEDWSFLTAE